MTGSPYGGAPGGPWYSAPNPKLQPRNLVLLVIAALTVGLAANVLATISFFRPVDNRASDRLDPGSNYSAADADRAIAAVCDAYDLVDKATAAAGGETSADPGVDFTIAVNIRTTASLGAALYFRVLEENPATPQTLADPVRQLASTYQELVLLQTARATQDQLDARYKRINELDPQIMEACQ